MKHILEGKESQHERKYIHFRSANRDPNAMDKGHYKSDCKNKALSNVHIVVSEDGSKTAYVGDREANDEEKKLLVSPVSILSAKCTSIDDESNMRIRSPLGLVILPDYKAGIWACIDSGMEVSLISEAMVQKLQIPTYQVKQKFKTMSFTGKDQEWVSRKCTIKMEIKERIVRVKIQAPHELETGKITCWDDGFEYPEKPLIKPVPLNEPVVEVNKTTLSTELEAAQAAGKEEVRLPERYKKFTKVFAEEDIPLPKHRPELDHEI
ncbi:hypothetical protein M404DRAFT_30990 [Pisolithus tinctorius Marx 270]|uniref:Uncharacterized protein n=1 Tax=Pisolithus tinctorius Marx 270 TaxID=870435 RepID=A0A0C3IPJ8_PISTI|nr:hypothetical protein M404DRAFT_30990 [Pisolithus tinctorius Marx 270]